MEHPICPSCGGELIWDYAFDEVEVGMSPEAMESFIELDEVGFPLDRSPAVVRLGALLDARLEAAEGAPLRVGNVGGVVDVELRPYVDYGAGVQGVKVIANVGESIYSMGLLEMLARLNAQLPLGSVVACDSAYGLPIGAVELYAFGAEVGLYYQHVIGVEALEAGGWVEEHARCRQVAAALSRQLRSAARMLEAPLPRRAGAPPTAPQIEEPGEGGLDASDSMRLDELQDGLLEDLFAPGPDDEELIERVRGFQEALGLVICEPSPGIFRFRRDSARVQVSVIQRSGRYLARYSAVLLSGVDLEGFEGEDASLPARALTALNGEVVTGRCLIEPEGPGDGGPYHVVFEKTLLGTDLDLSEFALTLAMVAEEADRMDDILQSTLGGMRADEVEVQEGEAEAGADLSALIRRLAVEGLPGLQRRPVAEVRAEVRHMLEEIRLPVEEDEAGDFWFVHGSARVSARVWQDERATSITLRAQVLREVERTVGLAEALNDVNRQIHFGAFVLAGGRHVDLVETILADDLAIEELAYALVSIGQLADTQDDRLKALFGGQMGNER